MKLDCLASPVHCEGDDVRRPAEPARRSAVPDREEQVAMLDDFAAGREEGLFTGTRIGQLDLVGSRAAQPRERLAPCCPRGVSRTGLSCIAAQYRCSVPIGSTSRAARIRCSCFMTSPFTLSNPGAVSS